MLDIPSKTISAAESQVGVEHDVSDQQKRWTDGLENSRWMENQECSRSSSLIAKMLDILNMTSPTSCSYKNNEIVVAWRGVV